MKIYNFKINIQMQELGDLPESSETDIAEKFDDDPLKQADQLMSKWMKQIKGNNLPVAIGPMYPGECNGSSISRNFSIIAATFEDAQKILDRFHQLAKEIHDSAPAPAPTSVIVP